MECIGSHIDPRSKLLILLLINTVVLVSPNIQTEWICIAVIIISLICMGAYKKAVRSVLIYAGMLGMMFLCSLFPDNFLSALISMIVVCCKKLAPPLFFASGMIDTTKVGELVSAMQKLRIPKSIVITFAVTLRFFPAAKEEYSSIKDAMRLRGIGLTVVNVITRPLTVMESVLIPMMMRCAAIAEELSAATVTRGIESGGKRTSINELKMRVVDWIWIAIFTALTVFTIMGGVSL
jgi:ABC-type cobalt transport system, permease component CbiQ and related transporters